MKRENLRNLGLTKEAVNQIMTWNGYDIEAEKKKLKDTERILEELKAVMKAEKEAADKREGQFMYRDEGRGCYCRKEICWRLFKIF